MKQNFMKSGVFDEMQSFPVFRKPFEKFGLIPRVNYESDIDLSQPQQPKVIQWDKGFAAKSAGCIICN